MWPFRETNAAAMRALSPAGLRRRVFADGTFALLGGFMMAAAEPGNRQSRIEPHGVMPGRLFYALEQDDFSSKRHLAPSFCLSMISVQTLRVCREGKPVSTLG
jgi:hypothetical protein